MKKVSKISAAVLLAAASICCCKSDQDLTAPQVDAILVNALEQEEHEVSAGTNIDLVIELSDNENLKQVKLNVHSADDGHGHGGSTGQVYEPNVGSWSYSKIIDVSGTMANVNTSLSIPTDIKGHWHIEVMAIDASGNEAEEAFTTLHVDNAGLPTAMVVFNPAVDSLDGLVHIPLAIPQFSFNADVYDADGLDSIYWEIKTEQGILVDQQSMDATGVFNFATGNITISLPGAGLYDWTFRAVDQNGFYNEWVQELSVE